MNVLQKVGVDMLQAGVAVASKKVVGDVAKTLVTRTQTLNLEKYFMQAADAYSSGYTTFNTPSLVKFGASGVVGLAAFGAVVFAQRRGSGERDNSAEDAKSVQTSAVAGTAGLFAAFFVVMVFDILRRQKTFSKFTGTNMILQHAVFFSAPLLFSFVAIKLASPLDFKKSVFAACVVAVGVLLVAKKFYLVFKQNSLEKQVFTKIANVIDSCQGPGKAGCGHEHAGYMEAFDNMVKPYLEMINYALPEPLEAAEVARDIASTQIFDTVRNFV